MSKFGVKPASCQGCPLYARGEGFVPPFGDCKKGVLFVHGIPDTPELLSQTHCMGRRGDVLYRAMRWVPARREDYAHVGLLQCRPPADALTSEIHDAINHCGRHRVPFIKAKQPKVIVTTDKQAFTHYAGTQYTEKNRGYLYDSLAGVPLVGTFDLDMVGAGNMALLLAVRFDIATAVDKVEHPTPSPTCLERPSAPAFIDWCEHAKGSDWISVDIETPWGDDVNREDLKVVRCGFLSSKDPDLAITVPWEGVYEQVAKEFLAGPEGKLFWNSAFDVTVLERNGCPVGGKHIDVMWLWHFLSPDMPRNLACASTFYSNIMEWKSLNLKSPEFYNCIDVWTCARNYVGIRAQLESLGMWEIAQRHVVDFIDVLEAVHKRGLNVDQAGMAKLKNVLAAENAEKEAAIVRQAPPECCKIKWYKRPHPTVWDGEPKRGKDGVLKGFWTTDGEKWGVRQPFNAGSADDILHYVKFKGYKVPLHYRTGKETTDKKQLERLAYMTNDPLLREILEFRKTDKIESTYTTWKLGEDGRVHPELTLIPATGRLSCINPNFQNIPKAGKLADAVRACIIASPGNKLVAADFTGMESKLTGYFAGDEDYMLLADMNIYAYVAARWCNWHFSVSDIRDPGMPALLDYFKEQAKTEIDSATGKSLYDKFKAIVLGVGYGEGPRTMFYQHPGLFQHIPEADRMRQFYFKLFPKVKAWQDFTIIQAGKEGRVFNPYKYIRWFLDVPGEQSPAALAQKPQSTGAAMIKDDMLLFAEKMWLGNHMILQVHDELLFDVPEERVDEAIHDIRRVMERPREEMGGLAIKVAIKTGYNLRDMK